MDVVVSIRDAPCIQTWIHTTHTVNGSVQLPVTYASGTWTLQMHGEHAIEVQIQLGIPRTILVMARFTQAIKGLRSSEFCWQSSIRDANSLTMTSKIRWAVCVLRGANTDIRWTRGVTQLIPRGSQSNVMTSTLLKRLCWTSLSKQHWASDVTPFVYFEHSLEQSGNLFRATGTNWGVADPFEQFAGQQNDRWCRWYR